MKKLQNTLFTLLITLLALNLNAQEGTVQGKIIDDANGDEIPFANIFIPEIGTGTTTDLDGSFSIDLAEGVYTFDISYVGYEDLSISDINVVAGEVNVMDDIRISVPSEGEIIQEIVVTAKQVRNTETALMTIQRKSSTVLDGVSSQAIKRNGDGDAGEAIKRVTGVSVEGGKHVFVRGLGDRYTKTIFNGMHISGLDPDRNSVEMDIFPTNVIDNILVYKTAAPDLPGDFTGGVVDIVTKDFPEEFSSNISVGLAYNPQMNLNNDYLGYNGGAKDWIGMDDGTRALPFHKSATIPTITGSDNSNVSAITSSFNNTMGGQRMRSGLNTNLSYSIGNQIIKNELKLGYLAAVNYRSGYKYYDDYEINDFVVQNGAWDNFATLNGELAKEEVFWSALAGMSMKYKSHQLSLQYLRLQNGISSTGVLTRVDLEDNPSTIVRHNLEYEERAVDNLIISGQHKLNGDQTKVSWKFMPSFIEVDEPDIRLSAFELLEDGSYQLAPSVGAEVTRTYRNLQENNYNGKIDLVHKLNISGKESKIKVGGLVSRKKRDYGILNYNVRVFQQGLVDINGNPDALFAEENIWTPESQKGTYIQGNFQPSNTFEATQNITSAYAMNEILLSKKLKAIYGVRIEHAENRYTGQNNLGTIFYEKKQTLNELDFLPSINLVYNLSDLSNIRVSGSKTVARPTFKEISLAQIQNRITGRTFLGNLDLEQTDITNFDVRWENFFNRGEMFSISGFFKTFKNPIELVIFDPTSTNAFSPKNGGDSKVYGVELELRKNLGFITPFLKDLVFNNNITLVKSTTIDGNNRERSLVGQSPIILNSGLTYKTSRDFEMNVSYNFQGKRLSIAGFGENSRVKDIYEMPYHLLNIKMTKRIASQWTLSLMVDNLLDSYRLKEWNYNDLESQVFEKFSPGRTFSFSVNYMIK